LGVEIVHEMQARGRAQRADPGHAMAGELRQRLPAKARPSGAEQHHVTRAVAQARRRFLDGCKIAGLRRQAQERQGAVAVARLEPVERGSGTHKRIVEGRGCDTFRAGAFGARQIDRLSERHPSLPEIKAGRGGNGRRISIDASRLWGHKRRRRKT
jgi:hypothetical protein